jgi:hypothetical protein
MESVVLDKTESLCPVCLKRIKASVIARNGRTLISKTCKEHGKFECFHAWDDPFLYRKFASLSKKKKEFIKDATLDITSECNMDCPFCFSSVKGETYAPDIENLISRAESWGEGNILLYGGEPTLRKDVFEIIRRIKKIGLTAQILTNGLTLTPRFLEKCESAGLDRIQLQFDSLDDDINMAMRNRKLVRHRLQLIKDLRKTSIGLTLFSVLVKNLNDGQIDKIISFAASNCDKIVSLTFTSVSPEGRCNGLKMEYLSSDEIMKTIEENFGINKMDFVACTEFDIALSLFLDRLANAKRWSLAPCEALCYVIVKNSETLPLNRLVDLEKLSKILFNIVKSGEKNRVKILLTLFAQCVKQKVRIDARVIPFLMEVWLALQTSLITRRHVNEKFRNAFGLIVAPSQNRYNIDYNFIKKCNLYGDCRDGKFISFCEKNILSTGPKRPKSLNSNMIITHEKNRHS